MQVLDLLVFLLVVILAVVGLGLWLLRALLPWVPWMAITAGAVMSVSLARAPAGVVRRAGMLVIQRSVGDRLGAGCAFGMCGIGAFAVAVGGSSVAGAGSVVAGSVAAAGLLASALAFGVAAARIEATQAGVRTLFGQTPWHEVQWRHMGEAAPQLVARGCSVRVAYGDLDALHAVGVSAGEGGPVRSF